MDVDDRKRSTARPVAPATDDAGADGRDQAAGLPRLALIAVAATLLVFLAVRLGPALVGVKIFGAVDVLQTRYPWKTGELGAGYSIIPYVTDNLDSIFPGYLEMHSRFFAGDLPLWSAYAGAGTALMSAPGLPTLTPSSIWLLLLPTSWSLGFAKVVEVLLAFGGMLLWLRRLGLTWAAGGVAGLLYIGSGFMTAWANWTGQASAACLIPALFWAIERFVQIRTARSALPISLVVGFLLLSGFPAVAGHSLYAGGAYFLVRLVGARKSYSVRSSGLSLVFGVAAVLLGVGLSAVQVLPQASALASKDLNYRTVQFDDHQHLASLLSMLYPRIFNSVGFPNSNPVEAYAFLGFGALALAVLVVVAGRWSGVPAGTVWMLVVTFGLSAALVWEHGFWTDWLRHVPVFASNNSGRLRDMVALSGCALAGIGSNLLFRRDLPAAVRRRLVLGCGVLFGLGVLGTVIVGVHYRATISVGLLIQDAAVGLSIVLLVGVALLLIAPRAPAAATVPDIPARRRRPVVQSAVVVVLIALLGVQAGISVAYFWPLSSTENFYPRTPAIAAVQQQVGMQRAVTLQSFLGSSAEAYGIRTVTGHTFSPTPWNDLMTAVDPSAFVAAGQSPTNPAIDLQLSSPKLGSAGAVLDRLAVNTIVADPTMSVPGRPMLASGQAVTVRPPFGTGRVPVVTGSSVTVPLTPQNLRAVELKAAVGVPQGESSLTVTITITSAAGTTLASGSTTRLAYNDHPFQIPVAGEKLGAQRGELTLRIGVSQISGPPRTLVFAAAGRTVDVHTVGSQPDGLTETYTDASATVWSRSTALSRVRWAQSAVVLPTAAQRLATLANPATPDTTVVLSAPGPQPSGQQATVKVGDDTGDDVGVQVDAAGSGYLVVADSISDGWRATVNGHDATILDADHAFGAVFLAAGHSEVRFTYVGSGVRTGAAITALSILIVVAVLGGSFWYRRRRGPSGTVRNSITTLPGGDAATFPV